MSELPADQSPTIGAVMVVVPAHNEEQLLGRCLDSVVAAGRVLSTARPEIKVRTVVVLDRCRDRTEQVASNYPIDVVQVEAANVGVARGRGVALAIDVTSHLRPERVWIASTDADSVVPDCWLSHQVMAAESGARLVLGRVEPDSADLDESVHRAWHQRHPLDVGTEHVYGANLGIRLDLYQAIGGFAWLAEHEDVTLVSAARRVGVVPRPGTTVLTSGRLQGRVPGGFSGYLDRLRQQLADQRPAVLD